METEVLENPIGGPSIAHNFYCRTLQFVRRGFLSFPSRFGADFSSLNIANRRDIDESKRMKRVKRSRGKKRGRHGANPVERCRGGLSGKSKEDQ
ncbi:small GTP-binding protein [Anopheles sinensis]|uniref:Small GTP-binding protein n=1 Tax=Anopheles sinensis TaxID=74873 RepID=A0A084VKQ6_ANOSI|nr:small GTP-binding protein [Anopheles sinensis]